MMFPEASFLLGKCREGRRKCTILKADYWYILWMAFQKNGSIVLCLIQICKSIFFVIVRKRRQIVWRV